MKLVALGLLAGGCASAPFGPLRAPLVPSPEVAVGAAAPPGAAFALPAAPAEPGPDGTACLEALAARGVHLSRAPAARGVRTPLLLNAPIGGVAYTRLWSGQRAVIDCRLALALAEAGPLLGEWAVSEVLFSGVYDYRRMRRSDRMSRHAYGLAIDVHALRLRDGRTLWVEQDFRRGVDCAEAAAHSPLNGLGCRLGRSGLFAVVLTPDSDGDHYNHFHLDIAQLPRTEVASR